ncbi:ThuA domain-containing protein [Aliiglaciecola sp. 3_MG-2023]|uniref:ThuA domain-containing protein n=1 Tax=Aliiglaciecola sp. 3_MG-2023 TaxID=3062644 RepID=UPI0026E18098|nr:ThuA domain-containing protein [Aliiglaciecola sp. 3_MG-2023]MDO6692779.1 ThuA domain-containing protein [Aliiglaciecola sp. 3_MG-2023]
MATKNCLGIVTVLVATLLLSLSVEAKQFNVLVFTKTAGFHHTSVNQAISALKKMSEKHHFSMDWQEDANVFNQKNLAQYDVVMFLLTTGDILNSTQQQAFEQFIESGKGFVGVHSASDTEYDWPWYGQLVGRQFVIHPLIQTAELSVIDRSFPGTEKLPDVSLWTDEWYQYGPELSSNLNYILSIDESTYAPEADWGQVKGKGMGEFHPVAWYQEIHGGRAFYTGLGHLPAVYENTAFLEHLFGGMYWAYSGKGIRK